MIERNKIENNGGPGIKIGISNEAKVLLLIFIILEELNLKLKK